MGGGGLRTVARVAVTRAGAVGRRRARSLGPQAFRRGRPARRALAPPGRPSAPRSRRYLPRLVGRAVARGTGACVPARRHGVAAHGTCVETAQGGGEGRRPGQPSLSLGDKASRTRACGPLRALDAPPPKGDRHCGAPSRKSPLRCVSRIRSLARIVSGYNTAAIMPRARRTRVGSPGRPRWALRHPPSRGETGVAAVRRPRPPGRGVLAPYVARPAWRAPQRGPGPPRRSGRDVVAALPPPMPPPATPVEGGTRRYNRPGADAGPRTTPRGRRRDPDRLRGEGPRVRGPSGRRLGDRPSRGAPGGASTGGLTGLL